MSSATSIFGFPEFLTALALLVLVYNASDARYRFRIDAAAVPLQRLAFIAILVIGAGTLLIDLWYAEGLPTLPGPVGQAGLQAILACSFLGLIAFWVFTAFVRPPRFHPWNAKRFYRAIYWRVMRGDAKELAVVAEELTASMESIVLHAAPLAERGEEPVQPNEVQACAHHLLMLIGNRRLCKQVAVASPGAAISLFNALAKTGKHRLPLSAFVHNLMVEALREPDSILYDEADEFSSDLVGVAKPFSRALFGQYEVVEGLQHLMASPTDLGLVKFDLSAAQYEAYGSASLLFVDAFLKAPSRPRQSYALNSVFDTMTLASSGSYGLSEVPAGMYDAEPTRRVRVAVRFVKRVVELLEASERQPTGYVKFSEHNGPKDIFDKVADLMLQIVSDVAAVTGDPDRTWVIQHNLVWSRFFDFSDASQWRAVRRRFVRRLYAHIGKMNQFANFESARLLGFSLNVLGVEARRRGRATHDLAGFHRVLLNWFSDNYLTLRRDYPDVAAVCLVGGISFDEENSRLVKTYAKLTQPEPTRRYLELSPVRPEPWDRWS